MGSELLAESLAMHWVLVLNFEWFPRYASVNVGYFPGNSNGLGYSNPSEDQSSLPCAAANTLILPCAQGRAAPLGSRTVPTAHGRTKPCILTRHQHTASASQGFTQLRSKAMGEGTDEVRMRDAQKDTKEKLKTEARTSYKTRPHSLNNSA